MTESGRVVGEGVPSRGGPTQRSPGSAWRCRPGEGCRSSRPEEARTSPRSAPCARSLGGESEGARGHEGAEGRTHVGEEGVCGNEQEGMGYVKEKTPVVPKDCPPNRWYSSPEQSCHCSDDVTPTAVRGGDWRCILLVGPVEVPPAGKAQQQHGTARHGTAQHKAREHRLQFGPARQGGALTASAGNDPAVREPAAEPQLVLVVLPPGRRAADGRGRQHRRGHEQASRPVQTHCAERQRSRRAVGTGRYPDHKTRSRRVADAGKRRSRLRLERATCPRNKKHAGRLYAPVKL